MLIFRLGSDNHETDACSAVFETDAVEMMLISPSEPDGDVEHLSKPHMSNPQTEIDSQVFFMDASSHFKSANIATRGFTSYNIVAMSIKLSQDEHIQMQTYLLEMLRAKTAYGSFLIPLMLVPSCVSSFCSDLNSTNPGEFKSLTSCQACLHTLRNGLELGRSITANLQCLNSRCVSTNRLFSTIEPFSRRIDVETLRLAKIRFRKSVCFGKL